VLPPVGKQRRYPQLTLSVIHAIEQDTPTNREAVEWKLITDLPVDSFEAAIEKLDWYSRRWKIEVFHKILKSGCKAEESKLRTADRIKFADAVGENSRQWPSKTAGPAPSFSTLHLDD
jgi:hypothetical protein